MSIYIEDYSEKSFVVRGETSNIKDDLLALGGKWNNRLNEKNNGSKFAAWVFWADKRKEIEKWLLNGCQKVGNRRFVENKSSSNSYSNHSASDSTTINRLEAKVDRLSKLLEAICDMHGIEIENKVVCNTKTKELAVKNDDISDDDLIDNIEPVAPTKRLLGRKLKPVVSPKV